MITILLSIGIMVLLAVVFGVGLAAASKRFAVETDPRVEQLQALLPGANCGACGRAGCGGTAEAMAKGDCAPGGCPVSTKDAVSQIAALLGMTVTEREPSHAVVRCRGGYGAIQRHIYVGVHDCRAAFLIHGGDKACEYGCLGYGTCVESCPFGALRMGPEGVPVVDDALCTACGKCEKACPKRIIAILPKSSPVQVLCRSKDKGALVTKFCKSGCIGCKKCEKTCKHDAIHVTDFLAEIDVSKCTACGDCIAVCPRHVIVDLQKALPAMEEKESAA